ncbi:MAG: hypothetical protein FJX77_01690 [Armatimonadetes bacterium]|nr:hypothetical protein [Armatimonadota bacterium]
MNRTILWVGGLLPALIGQAAQPPQAAPAPAQVPPPPPSETPRLAVPVAPRTAVGGQNSTAVFIRLPPASANVRVSVDLDNVSIREALRSLCEGARKEHTVDADVPDQARVTIKARNVRLGTALDLISQAADAGWVMERRGQTERVRVGKSLPRSAANLLFDGSVTPSFVSGIGPLNISAGGATRWDIGVDERATFQCPHCKGQATVLRRRQAPKCTRCERTFQPDWQFCPADGAKRPAEPGVWQYCPLCGKRVQARADGKEAEPDALVIVPSSGLSSTAPRPSPAR